MSKGLIKGILIVLVAVAGIASCKTERDPCLDPKVVNLRVGVYRRADTGTAIIDTQLTSPVIIALGASAAVNTFLYATRTSKLSLTLDGRNDSTRWVLRPDSSGTAPSDTLTFYYQHQLHFLSNACGYTYFYSLDSVLTTHVAIDSVKIVDHSVTSTATTGDHVKIYYHR